MIFANHTVRPVLAALALTGVLLSTTFNAAAAQRLEPQDRPAQDRTHVTTAGHVVTLPALETLDCPSMTRVLNTIDRTAYRRGPRPKAVADEPLFEYERALSNARYQTCARPVAHR